MRFISSVGLVLFYGLIGLLLCCGIYHTTQNKFLSKEQLLFVFLLVSTYYYFLQIYTPNSKKRNQLLLSFPIILGIGFCTYLYSQLEWIKLNQFILLFVILLGLFYWMPNKYLNLRRIPFLKNILVALVWVLMPWIFISFHDVNVALSLLTVEVFVFIFLISMRFDEIDHEVDVKAEHLTGSAILSKHHSTFIILMGSSVIVILDVLMWKFLYVDRNKIMTQFLMNLLLIYFLFSSIKGIRRDKITYDTILLMKVVCLCWI